MLPMAIWAVLMIVATGLFLWFAYTIRQRSGEDEVDTGLAILEFGRAYPDEAIRQVAMTDDGFMVFLRLWTGRCGCMKRSGGRYLCHLIDPKKVMMVPTDDGRGLNLQFAGLPALDGDYRFNSDKQAAEVSLWILGSFTVDGVAAQQAEE
ncbi:hypothetical protein [Rhizobium alvei]|uniref:Uncharacterized protein n=1 Tax=Rhizobium alvei TaxID=1132659 RepID=A0ABT8YJU5_9HYPH|nr:hypothetical protein [Rhizobium alvei]MDO6963920.1 hypothetical protein [Rhizobium alvei]